MFLRFMDLSYSLLGMLRYYANYKSSCYLPKDKVRAYQYKKLKVIILTAYRDVDFYREKYVAAGFNPQRDFKCLDDINKVPTLSKDEARRAGALMHNPKHRGPALQFKTSGSTGQPYRAKKYPGVNGWLSKTWFGGTGNGRVIV